MTDVNLYESRALRDITGPAIRPGGFQLTDRGLVYCGLAPGARVLDLGCGTGATVHHLRFQHGLWAMGIDRSFTLLEEGARSNGGFPMVRGCAEQIPIGDGSVEAVFCECVLSLCSDPLGTLQEVVRVLQVGGYLVLTDVYSRDSSVPAQEVDKSSVGCCLQGIVGRTTVEARIATAGFDLLLWEDHSMLLKQLAGQLIWTYGSLDAFWSVIAGSDAAGAFNSGGGGGCRRPGYYLLVAQKPVGRLGQLAG
jgi:SAM-dependent methyltransferase